MEHTGSMASRTLGPGRASPTYELCSRSGGDNVQLPVIGPAALVVNRTALWVVMGACSAVAVGYMVLTTWQGTTDEPRLRRLSRCLSAVMDGLGFGLTAALVILIAAAIIVRLQP